MHGDDDRERGMGQPDGDDAGVSAEERWAAAPERGRQGYPGSPEERFGPGGYDQPGPELTER